MAKKRKNEEDEEIDVQSTEEIKPIKITKKVEKVEKVIDTPKQTLSLKQSFLKNTEKTNFTIYQNGTLIYTYNENTKINVFDKYFEINGKKYTYLGIEIKYA